MYTVLKPAPGEMSSLGLLEANNEEEVKKKTICLFKGPPKNCKKNYFEFSFWRLFFEVKGRYSICKFCEKNMNC